MTCKKCKGWGWTNKIRAVPPSGINNVGDVAFDPPTMAICECSKGPVHRADDPGPSQ